MAQGIVIGAGGGSGVAKIRNIQITTAPTKTAYTAGEALDLTGIVIKAFWTSGLQVDVTEECTFTPANGTVLYEDTSEVVASYTNGSDTYTVALPITVTRVLASLRVDTEPKSSYTAGEALDLSDAVVSAVFTSGRSEVVAATPSISDGTVIYETTTSVTWSYTESGITKTVTSPLTVQRVLKSISISSNPTKMTYKSGETISATGMTLTATYDATTRSVSSGWTISPTVAGATEGTQQITVSFTENGVTKTTTLSITVKNMVPFDTGSDADILAVIQALAAGTTTAAETGWSVGDTRTISLSAMSATGVGESHAAQSVTLVIAHDFVKNGALGGIKPANSSKPLHFVITLKDCLNETGYMNNTNTNTGSWKNSKRRTWCNNVFAPALPAYLKNNLIDMSLTTASVYNGSTNETTTDKCGLFAAKEIFGGTATAAGADTSYSNLTEFNALTQVEYYKTAANRIKKVNGSANPWWERSPHCSNSNLFCRVLSDGGANHCNASSALGLAPFFCI